MSAKTRKPEAGVELEHARSTVTFEEIAARAYEIHLSGSGGDELENWLRAEDELTAASEGKSSLDHLDEAKERADIAA